MNLPRDKMINLFRNPAIMAPLNHSINQWFAPVERSVPNSPPAARFVSCCCFIFLFEYFRPICILWPIFFEYFIQQIPLIMRIFIFQSSNQSKSIEIKQSMDQCTIRPCAVDAVRRLWLLSLSGRRLLQWSSTLLSQEYQMRFGGKSMRHSGVELGCFHSNGQKIRLAKNAESARPREDHYLRRSAEWMSRRNNLLPAAKWRLGLLSVWQGGVLLVSD